MWCYSHENEQDYGGDPPEPRNNHPESVPAMTEVESDGSSTSNNEDINNDNTNDNIDISGGSVNVRPDNENHNIDNNDNSDNVVNIDNNGNNDSVMSIDNNGNTDSVRRENFEIVHCNGMQRQLCDKNVWIMMDSGAQRHIFKDMSILSNVISEWPAINLITADNRIHRVRAIGDINKILKNVFIFTGAGQDLISTSALARVGYYVVFGPVKVNDITTDVAILRRRDGRLLATGELINGLYYVKRSDLGLPITSDNQMACAVMPIPGDPAPCAKLLEAHRRLGHLSLARMRLLTDESRVFDSPVSKQMVKDAVEFVCPTCVQANIQHHMTRAIGTGHRFDTYLGGEVYTLDFKTNLPPSIHGKCTKTLMVYGIKSGDVYYYHFDRVTAKNVYDSLYNLYWYLHGNNKIMKCLCHDMEEILKAGVTNFATEHGVVVQHSAPYIHQQNGSAEAILKHDVASMRALLLDSGLNDSMWTYALDFVAYTRNRSPVNDTISSTQETPIELIRGQKPTLRYMRPFGERVIVKLVDKEQKNKINPNGALAIIVGFEPSNPSSYGVMMCEAGYPVKFRNELISLSHLQGVDKHQLKFLSSLLRSQAELREVRATSMSECSTEDCISNSATLASNATDVDACLSDDIHVSLIVTCDPAMEALAGRPQFNLYQARKLSAAWPQLLEAMKEEWNKIQEFNTFEMIKSTSDHQLASIDVTPLTIFFKVTRIANDQQHLKVKCRVALRGDTLNREEIGPTASPTASTTTVRFMLNFAAVRGLLIRKFDVESAYLHADQPLRNGKLVTCSIPGELVGSVNNQIALMRKSLYGDPEAGRQFYLLLRGILFKMGFRPCNADLCLYTCVEHDNTMTYLITHVDDMLLMYAHESTLIRFREQLGKHVGLKDEGIPRKFLGLYIDYGVNGDILLQQESYEDTILERTTVSKRVRHVPLMLLSKYTDSDRNRPHLTDKKLFELMGLYRYVCDGVRPDLMFACSRAMKSRDGLMFNHMTQYLQEKRGVGLTYCREPIELHAFSDASYNIDIDGSSQLGYAVFLTHGSGAFAYSSKKISTSVPLSSTEAELVAAVECWKTIQWTVDLLSEFNISIGRPIPMYVDNNAIVNISDGYQNHPKMRHLCPKVAALRQAVMSHDIVLLHVPSEENCADIFTKPVQDPTIFNNLLRKIIG